MQEALQYEIITLPEKHMVGLAARTSNNDPKMGETIGGLWQRLFGEGLYGAIPGAVNDRSIGLYSDYEAGVDGPYQITVGRETDGSYPVPAGMVEKVIPAGSYVKVVVRGDHQEAVGRCWEQLWSMDLKRTYTGDFEEYLPVQAGEAPEIHIYLAIR